MTTVKTNRSGDVQGRGAVRAGRGCVAAGEQACAGPMRAAWIGAVMLLAMTGGCTGESTRVALESQQRANDVQQAVFDRQHEALRGLLYRDLVQKLEQNGEPLTEQQRALLNQAWNDRDLLEFWTTQNERAKALRIVGVDAKLYADQSVVDLLTKSFEAKADRAREAAAAAAGEQAGTAVGAGK